MPFYRFTCNNSHCTDPVNEVDYVYPMVESMVVGPYNVRKCKTCMEPTIVTEADESEYEKDDLITFVYTPEKE